MDIRIWNPPLKEGGEPTPSTKGITIAASLLPELKNLIDLAIEQEAELQDDREWRAEVRDFEVGRRT